MDLSLRDLQSSLISMGEPAYRALQTHQWLYRHHVSSFDEMTILPISLRKKFGEVFSIQGLEIVDHKECTEDDCDAPTEKLLLRLPDGELIEAVIIASSERMTACISSQAGCPLQCTFCATGRMGFKRNLSSGEMTAQVSALNTIALERSGKSITNIVFMGMGEPLLNTENVMETIENLSRRNYSPNLSQKKITISTVGIIPEILRIANTGLKTKLAVSLHAADQQKREALMPVAARQYPLKELGRTLADYTAITGIPVTVVYMLLEGINDSREDAKRLAGFAKSFLCKINLIDYNPNINIDFSPVKRAARDMFQRYLIDSGLHVTVRKSYGTPINAACGQLATTVRDNRINH
jgi:23S rRNA (adenine2503-C2)-methyltransferase